MQNAITLGEKKSSKFYLLRIYAIDLCLCGVVCCFQSLNPVATFTRMNAFISIDIDLFLKIESCSAENYCILC